MLSTSFDSPHGLANRHNYSTARDILTLSIACMKNARFREVVVTKTHKAVSLSPSKTIYTWESTNKLLGRKEHWVGCKTGVTDPAGPCFSGFYEN
jgi:serine-type D-Ala-D-Ala carboxypeptidase (penicillin-binding protein 5/6)